MFEPRRGHPGQSSAEVLGLGPLARWMSATFLEGSYQRRLAGTPIDASFDRLERRRP